MIEAMSVGEVAISLLLLFVSVLGGLWGRGMQVAMRVGNEKIDQLRSAWERDMREIENWRGQVDQRDVATQRRLDGLEAT